MGHFKLTILYSLIFCLGITGTVTGQNTGSVQRVKAIEPFIKAEDVHIQKDFSENIWITTPVKILKYNSAEVVDYNKFRGIPREIGNEFIETYTDSENKIWLAGNLGLAVYKPAQDEFQFVSSITGRIYAMREDTGHQLWIAAENGIFKLNIDADKKDFSISRFISENTMAADVVVHGNQIIFAGPNGILTIDRRSGKFSKVDMGYYQNLQITSILPMNDFVVFGTKDNGLYKTDPQFKNLQKVYSLPYSVAHKEITGLQRFNNEIIIATDGAGILRMNRKMELLENNTKYPQKIYDAYLDDQNLLWMVAKEGLFLQNFAAFSIEKLKHDPSKYASLSDDFVTASATDSHGNIWFGTGKGISIWTPGTQSWRHIENLNFKRNMKTPDHITDLASVGEHMWVATAKDGVYKVNINTLLRAHYSVDALYKTPVQQAQTLFIDSREDIWIGGEEGYLTQIKSNSDIKTFPIKDVSAIAELSSKQLIVATRSRVHSLNPSTGRITDLNALFATDSLVYYNINDLKITNEGRGLFATEGAGLLLYDFESKNVEILGKEKGLPSDNIVAVQWVSNDEFWISTDNGLAFYDDEAKTAKSFSEINGFTTNELTTGFAKLDDGSLVLGSTKGINIFKPTSLLAQQEFRPKLKLQKIILPSEKKGETKGIELTGKSKIEIPEDKGFQIKFTGISHLNPENILYSWKMQGLEEDWSKATSLNSVSYGNLAPGNYIFKVKSRLENSGWSTPQELKINIPDSGGTVSSVYLFMGISVLAMLVIFVFVFTKKSKDADMQAKTNLRNQLKKEFKKPVESAVHSLSKISASASDGENEDLQRYAARFDHLFNQILNFNYEESAYEISKIDLHRHLSGLVKDFEPVFQEKSLEMSINDQWGNSAFYYNRELLDKIFFSLISGSACYSIKSGKIIINVIETSVGDLKLQITDNGRGIPEHHLKVLERKKQVKQKRKFRDKNGLDYVLKAKDIILKSGGSFSYESEKNEGATFTVVMKNRKDEYRKVPERAAEIFKSEKSKANPISEVPVELTNLSESKILIIEKDEEVRALLITTIGKYCQIYQATTAEEGIEKAGMIFPDIIVSATVLPDMNAFQLTKMLKRNHGLNHINIFMMADEDLKLNEEQLDGFTQVIRKPLDMNLVLQKISRTLIWQRKLQNAYVQSHIDEQEVKFRSESDERFITNLIDIIVQNISNDNFTVHDLSGKMSMSSNTLFMKLKSLVNLSPQDFMEFTRLNYARDLLNRGEFNIMEVAYKSGFSSPKLFYSSFKKFYGYTPGSTVENNSAT